MKGYTYMNKLLDYYYGNEELAIKHIKRNKIKRIMKIITSIVIVSSLCILMIA